MKSTQSSRASCLEATSDYKGPEGAIFPISEEDLTSSFCNFLQLGYLPQVRRYSDQDIAVDDRCDTAIHLLDVLVFVRPI